MKNKKTKNLIYYILHITERLSIRKSNTYRTKGYINVVKRLHFCSEIGT